MVLSTTQAYKILCNNNPSSNNREIPGKDSYFLFVSEAKNTDSSSPFAMDPGMVLFSMSAYKILHATTTQEATIGKFWQRIHGHL
jgi:hypothetical protein